MITTSDSIKAISAALLQFQGLVEGVKKDGKNSHFRSKYATLENVIDTARPALQECGICIVQAPGSTEHGALQITTRLIHAESGEWMQSTMGMPLQKLDPQGTGSATTYGLRYSLMAMLMLPPTDDDDGEAAMERSPQSLSSAAVNPPAPPVEDESYAPPPRRKSGLPEYGWKADGSRTSFWLKQDGTADELKAQLLKDAEDCHTKLQLDKLKEFYRGKARELKFNKAYMAVLAEEFATIERSILNSLDAAELAEVPLETALKASLINAG